MANSLREVKIRISSTESTAQITKAMYMVSQSKVKRAEKTYKQYQDFMKRITEMVKSIVEKAGDDYTHPMLTKREVNKTAYLIITSDRGLAGAYNSSIFKALTDKINEVHKSNDEFICQAIGKQGFAYLKRMNYPLLVNEATFVRDDVEFIDIAYLANKFVSAYLDKKIDKLVIVYNHYVNSLTQEILFEELLPINSIEGEVLLPMYVKDILFGIILDAKCAEHSARMNAMKSATDNALEVIDKLQLLYNRARQNVVTTELIDIIGGANAIGGDK